MSLSSNDFPRISFGIIVLNGEPFTKYCLRQLYPQAYEIIVVEGGSDKAAGFAPQGRSTDGTLEALREFKDQEDPENKLQIVTREGFWPEKDEQSQAYAQRATGDYLWQVDIDEFYRHADIDKVRAFLAADPQIDAVSFKQYAFWGSPGIVADGFNLRSDRSEIFHRLFKWGKNYRYQTHRPPTVVDGQGVDLRQMRWITGEEMAKKGVFLFHYSLLFPIQVRNKCRYYATPTSVTFRAYAPGILDWAENAYFHIRRPFRVHNVYRHLSWLRRIDITHPEEADHIWQDALSGKIKVELRDNRDAEALINNRYYQWMTRVLSLMATMLKHPPLKWFRRVFLGVGNRLRRMRLSKEGM
jgi:glycosyltransferase involved in cell wall biosynthesis